MSLRTYLGGPKTCPKIHRWSSNEETETPRILTLKISNDPSFVNSSGTRLLQPSRIASVVSLLTSVLLTQSQSYSTGVEHPKTYQIPTSLVPPKIVVPLPGRGITYLFSFIVFACFASPLTSTVCPLTGNMPSSGTSSFAPSPLAFTKMNSS